MIFLFKEEAVLGLWQTDMSSCKMVQSNPSLCLMFPLLEQTEKTLAYIQQKCDNAEPSSNNSATSRNISAKTDKLGTLMHCHSKI